MKTFIENNAAIIGIGFLILTVIILAEILDQLRTIELTANSINAHQCEALRFARKMPDILIKPTEKKDDAKNTSENKIGGDNGENPAQTNR